MLQRLISYWVYGAALAALLLLALAPLVIADRTLPVAAAFLHLPAYMIHQYEEHDRDRFRRFLNATIGQGTEVLSPRAVFITNVPIVWGLLAASLYAAARLGPEWALVPAWLVLVNAIAHIAHGLVFRRYNPGLATALVVFIPLGVFTLYAVDAAGAGSLAAHAVGLGIALAIHAAILLHVRHRRRLAAPRA